MTTHIVTHIPFQRFSFNIILLSLSLGLLLVGCSRSSWIKTTGQEVTPKEQLECLQDVQKSSKEEAFEQEILEQRIEQCMLDKGYKLRPWWLLNDLHWHIKKPTF